MNPLVFDAITIPVSLLTLAGILLFFRWWCAGDMTTGENQVPGTSDINPGTATTPGTPSSFHPRAWAPFIAIILSIPVALFILHLSHVSMINLIMLVGAVTAIVLAPQDARTAGLSKGAKHAGIIIFDICGAGALGFVIVQSGFAQAALVQLTLFIPIILIPFLLAACIETAQGSRVVTAVITAEVLAGSTVAGAIHPLPLILLISAGSCVISYVTDPFFWLVQRTTGDDVRTVVRNYTVPVALAGVFLFIIALGLEYFVLW
jgi:GntP family gluconate:H+ symporter